MILEKLLKNVLPLTSSVDVLDVTTDSRKVKPGSLFIAYKGVARDAHNFIPDVIAKGAAAIVGEQDIPGLVVPYFKVANGRLAWAKIMANWYDNPQKKLKIIGVTGTDGKTTTSTLIYKTLKQAGLKVGLISTVAAYLGGEVLDTGFHVTSPDPDKLFEFLKKAVDLGLTHLVLETTSHALDQERYYGIDFVVGVLTNITHEHLDYHKTFEHYRDAKLKLFTRSKVCVLNQDDPSSEYIKANVTGKTIFYTKSNLIVTNPVLAGDYNLYNIGAAQAVAKVFDIKLDVVETVVQKFSGIPGRLQEIKNNLGIRIIVDFAHTPNALERVLAELRTQLAKDKKLVLVFGCAGLRDTAKRPMMGEIARRLADKIIVTAEDPRTEELDDIYRDIFPSPELRRGGRGEVFREDDRQSAITKAISMSKPGDIVVITGKGHEKSMCFGTTEMPWDDVDAVKRALGGN